MPVVTLENFHIESWEDTKIKKPAIPYIIPCCILLSFALTACEKAPESTVKNGVLMSEKANEQGEPAKADTEPAGQQSVQEILQSFPEHFTKEFSYGTNCLNVDADVVIPKGDIKIYEADAAQAPWTEAEIESLSADLVKAQLTSADRPLKSSDILQNIPYVGITYYNEGIPDSDKAEGSGEAAEAQGIDYSPKMESFCQVWNAQEWKIKAEPKRLWDGSFDGTTFSVIPMYEGIPIATEFPTTGTEIIENEGIGGWVRFAENQVIEFNILGKYSFDNRAECNTLASLDTIAASLQAAIESSDIMFSREMRAVKLSLEYLLTREDDTIRLLPVWNVGFDLEYYHDKLAESQNEVQLISMSTLCINAIDGSVAYAV